MNNDLIKRSELKAFIKKHYQQTSQIKSILAFINIAPTVEVGYLTNCANCERAEKIRSKRPQGKWIYTEKTDKEKGYGGYCSNCKCDMPIFVEDWKQKYCETKFCPNCGAKMQKGGTE